MPRGGAQDLVFVCVLLLLFFFFFFYSWVHSGIPWVPPRGSVPGYGLGVSSFKIPQIILICRLCGVSSEPTLQG